MFALACTLPIQTVKAQSLQPSLIYEQTLFPKNNVGLQYASVYDGYLWIVSSDNTYVLSKYNVSTLELLGSVPLAVRSGDSYSAYVHDGVVYVMGEGSYIETFNESTLAEINYFTQPNIFVSAIYDPNQNLMLFGDGDNYPTLGIWAVSPAQIANNSDYYRISINGSASYNWTGTYSDEEQIAVFENNVYVLCVAMPTSTTYAFSLYNSSSLTNWSLDWTKYCSAIIGKDVDKYNYSIFSSVSASTSYLACGIVSNSTTGAGTYRIELMNSSGVWSEYDSGLPETSFEDHPEVNFLTNSLLLFEYSQRQGSGPNELYLYKCNNNTLTYQCSTPYRSYNDRIVCMDSNNNVYVSSCMTNANLVNSEVIEYQLSYSNFTISPAPTSTPTPSPSPTPTPTPTPTPMPTPTSTATPTPTPISTSTPDPTLTPVFTPSPTPQTNQSNNAIILLAIVVVTVLALTALIFVKNRRRGFKRKNEL